MDDTSGRPANFDHPAFIGARQPEYEIATFLWVGRTIEALMRARDPIYAQLRPEPGETVPSASDDDHDMAITNYSVAMGGQISVPLLIAGDFGDLHAAVSGMADQRLEQTMRAYFASLTRAAQHAGTAVDAHGDVVEGLLTLFERMDLPFDDRGNLRPLQLVVSPEDESRARAAIDSFTPDQARRFEQIIATKREAYRAARRRRRLPRLPD